MLSHFLHSEPHWGRELRRMRRAIDDVFGETLRQHQEEEAAANLPSNTDPSVHKSTVPAGVAWTPRFDITETDKALLVQAELPGLSKEDIRLNLDGSVLCIQGETHRHKPQDKELWHYSERRFGRFQRSLQLPDSCDPDGIQARFENGLLLLEIPKFPEDQKPGCRSISIQ